MLLLEHLFFSPGLSYEWEKKWKIISLKLLDGGRVAYEPDCRLTGRMFPTSVASDIILEE